MNAVVIAPSFEVEKGGVAAYAIELAHRLPGGIAGSKFFALHPAANRPSGMPPAALQTVERDAANLNATLRAADAQQVLLHYSGFGYAADACPAWLLDGLGRWKQDGVGRTLHIFFHELATEEPWWRRTAWSQPRQRQVIRGLARLADRVATSCPYFVQRLRETYGVEGGRMIMAPIPPTLATAPVERRSRGTEARRDGLCALVFGLPGTRAWTLRSHRALLRNLSATGALTRLVLAGHAAAPDEANAVRTAALEIVAKPDLDAEALRLVANGCDFGLVWNWASILGKSTVFANLCALGVPAVIGRKGTGETTGFGVVPAALACDGSRAEVDRAARELGDPARRAELRANALRLAREDLSWEVVAARLGAHFVS